MDRKERVLLILLASVNFTHILDFMIMMPLGNFLMPHFDISAQYFSLIVAAYPVTAFVSGLIAAFMTGKKYCYLPIPDSLLERLLVASLPVLLY